MLKFPDLSKHGFSNQANVDVEEKVKNIIKTSKHYLKRL